ncbi:ABC transporter ATP-binding protein [Metallumcola ferriviriculae]|uniref:ABC transporter ATP-binding protein n=1 Tax=Metallumcola ferriviriculae TaxID=3039180 RepID=A0AAU0UM00_9FIRM|nr:ABC transporter ATP-binding protein [Desulfitibacteraceae bacterium MK1]
MSHLNTVIRVSQLSKVYKLYDNPTDRLKESLSPLRRIYHKEFYALKDISFSVNKGETVGIIGRNGSGKSTLLKAITNVMTPTSGQVNVSGKVSALLELGAGFNPDFTGMENIYLNGSIMGFSKEEMDSKLEQILSFADIGDFINQPVKTYSSGMFVRLAFGVAINVDPEILIVDEALAVGDIRFQQKCFRKIEELQQDKTVLFVSHDIAAVNKFCNRVIWLNDGMIVEDGEPEEVAKRYQAFMINSQLKKYESMSESKEETPVRDDSYEQDIEPIDPSLDVLGDSKAKIIGISLIDAPSNEKVTVVQPGQKLKLFIKVKYNCVLRSPIIGASLKDRLGNIVTQFNSYVLDNTLDNVDENDLKDYCFEFLMPPLKSGFYSISPAVASGSQSDHVQHCWIHDALIVRMEDGQTYDLPGYMFLDGLKFRAID